MTLDHRQHHADTLRSALSVLLYPLQAVINLPAKSGSWLSESLSTRERLMEENEQLTSQQLLINTRLQKFKALESENQRLRELLGSSIKVGERTMVAELMTIDMAPFSQQVVINKGSLDGVYENQPLLDANGIMGQTLHVTPFTSTAILITDPSHATPVEINRNGLRTIAFGTGDTTRLELLHIPNNADIEVGDLLVTSGLGGRFPPRYPVANVTRVIRKPGEPFAEVSAEPTGKLLSTREVLLVWSTTTQANPSQTKEESAPDPAPSKAVEK